MEKTSKEKSVVDFYVLCNKLKYVIRTGWQNWNVQKERLESVAEHIFGVQSLAIAMWSQYKYDIDLKKVILMLSVHELEEIVIGDLTLWDINSSDKQKQGHEAVQLILANLLQKEQIEQLIFEFDERQTKEARFAYYCDKLECDLQSKLYDEEGCVDLTKQDNNPRMSDSIVLKHIQSGKTWSAMWMEFGRQRYNYDPNFAKVSEYAQSNGISYNKKMND